MSTDEIRFDDSRFPLVCVEFVGACSDEQFATYLERMNECRARAEREDLKLAVVVDTLRAARPVSAKQRKMQADDMAQHDSAKTMVGMAFVIDNPLIRGVLTAILWFQRMDWEHVVVRSRAEAESWATSLLERPSRSAM